MSKTKYIVSGGLAFSEEKDMEKLRRFSLKGWHVRNFKFMGYALEKGESSDFIYSLDYRSLKEDEKEEYFGFFASAGWAQVASEADMHLFRASPGTKPIYTDRDTTIEKYKNSSDSLKGFIIPLVLTTILSWIGAVISYGLLESILFVVAIILSVIAIPATWTLITTYSNKWKEEGRVWLVNLVKVVPFLLLLSMIIILLFTTNMDDTVKLLIYMLIGAIVFPTAIWALMSLYIRVKKN